jgi:hypothetical protein
MKPYVAAEWRQLANGGSAYRSGAMQAWLSSESGEMKIFDLGPSRQRVAVGDIDIIAWRLPLRIGEPRAAK